MQGGDAMNKKLISLFTALALIAVSLFSVYLAFANDVTWSYDSETNTLYISGTGAMDDYSSPYATPWSNYLNLIEKLVVEDGVTSIGSSALSGASALTCVDLSDTVEKIGAASFSSCPNLLELSLSPNVTGIADISFSTNGAVVKTGFVLNVTAGSYPLYYAIKNGVNFSCASVKTGVYDVKIPAKTGMCAYFPYTARLEGTFAFYSVSKYDPQGYLYDDSFNLIDDNDDYSVKYNDEMDSCDFSITDTLESGKTYYFATDLINPSLKADYKIYIKGKDYNVSGGIYVMANPAGELTDIKLYDAYLSGVATNGEYSLHVTSIDYTVELECDGIFWNHTFDPDSGENCDIPFMGCDLNRDGVVNAKDFAIMQKTNYRYIQYFYPFMNFKY